MCGSATMPWLMMCAVFAVWSEGGLGTTQKEWLLWLQFSVEPHCCALLRATPICTFCHRFCHVHIACDADASIVCLLVGTVFYCRAICLLQSPTLHFTHGMAAIASLLVMQHKYWGSKQPLVFRLFCSPLLVVLTCSAYGLKLGCGVW